MRRVTSFHSDRAPSVPRFAFISLRARLLWAIRREYLEFSAFTVSTCDKFVNWLNSYSSRFGFSISITVNMHCSRTTSTHATSISTPLVSSPPGLSSSMPRRVISLSVSFSLVLFIALVAVKLSRWYPQYRPCWLFMLVCPNSSCYGCYTIFF